MELGRGVVGNSTSWINIDSYNNLVNKFIDAGYAVFDCNGMNNDVHDIWGCPRGIEAWRKAYEYIIKNYNVISDVYIYGFSMGGLTALNLINNHFPNVKAIALGSPVLWLKKYWDVAVSNCSMLYFNSETAIAYSSNLVAGFDPYNNIVDEKYIKNLPPIKIWYGGTEDGNNMPYVNKQHAIDIINGIKANNGIGYYREVANAGHEICYGANGNINKEILYWFNRF